MRHTVVVGSQACVRDTPEWHQTNRQRSSDELLIAVSIGIILLRRIVHTVAGLVSRGVVLLSDDKKYLQNDHNVVRNVESLPQCYDVLFNH